MYLDISPHFPSESHGDCKCPALSLLWCVSAAEDEDEDEDEVSSLWFKALI